MIKLTSILITTLTCQVAFVLLTGFDTCRQRADASPKAYSGTTFVPYTAKVPLATQLTYTSNATKTDASYPVAVMIETTSVTLPIKAYLQGAILTTPNETGYSTLMRDNLRARKLIPPTDPYRNRIGFTHVANPQNQSLVSSAVLSTTGTNAIVDWVFVELRDKTDAMKVVATKAGLIQRDGDVVATDGFSLLTFNIPTDYYYVTLRHRNHMGVTTQKAVLLNGVSETIDFTKPITSDYGKNALVRLSSTRMALWAGDTNGDDKITLAGANSDINPLSSQILNDKGNGDFSVTYLLNAYSNSDTDLTGMVILVGSQSDIFLISANVLLHPANSSYSPSYVIKNPLQVVVKVDTVAENILLYQRSNGGWRNGHGLSTYKAVIPAALAKEIIAQKSQLDAYMDNGCTTEEVDYLIQIFKQTSNKKYLVGAENGINYLLAAQHTSGGWPQTYPDSSSYHKHITYNDGTMIHVVTLLKFIAESTNGYEVVDIKLIEKSKIALQKGIDCILKTQYKQNGNLTVWCAQHDRQSFLPAKARAFELPSLSGSESVGIVSFLMSINDPSTPIKNAIKASVEWLSTNRIVGIAVQNIIDPTQPSGKDRIVIKDPNSTIWARFYNLNTSIPFFTGRDSVPKATLAEIPNERRIGYAYYGTWPRTLLDKDYPNWLKKWGN